MNCHADDLHYIKTIRIPSAFVDCYIYYTDIPADSIVLQDGETVDWQWTTLEGIEALIQEGTFALPEVEQFSACRQALANALAERE